MPRRKHLEHALSRWDNLELIKLPAAESQGCNWARRLVQERWAGERYTLFLDSHHRFVPGWDALAIDMLESLRAYTRGYDLFHPHRILGWHLYDRATRVTHWADNPDSRQRFEITHQRIRALYAGRWRGRYGLGETRTASDCEQLISDRLALAP
jgi:hypothetical protein